MRDVLVRPAAAADIESIADYTIERWGTRQAATYVAALQADIESLAEFSERYPLHQDTHLGLRSMTSGHHAVFYLVEPSVVEIIRILHENADAARNSMPLATSPD